MTKANRGFTLIELMVVIAIIGLLSSITLSALTLARSKARDAKRLSEIRQLQLALEMYRNKNGAYPNSTGCGATVPNMWWCNSAESLSGKHWIKNNGALNSLDEFISTDPIDPSRTVTANWLPGNGGTYFYFSDGTFYMLVYGLEHYPNQIEKNDGVTSSWGQVFHYGDDANGIVTAGVSYSG